MTPPADPSALFAPYQATKITAKPRNRRMPMASNNAACSVISCIRKANRSFIELGGIGVLLRHAPVKHRLAGAGGLSGHHGAAFGDKADVIVDGPDLGVAGACGVDDLVLGQSRQQFVGVLASAHRDQMRRVDL